MRPTGRFHLGNYLGAGENWVNLQNEYDCYHHRRPPRADL